VSDRALARRSTVFAVTVCALLAVNDSLPYLGVRDDSCQTMFSGLSWSADENNHLFIPQRAVSDLWVYWTDVRARLDPPVPEHGRAADLARWLSQEDRAYNDEALRVVVDQLCDLGHRVSLERRREESEGAERIDDACTSGSLAPRWWIPVRLYETDFPADARELAR
jgi:hypothetical protein